MQSICVDSTHAALVTMNLKKVNLEGKNEHLLS